MNSRTRLSKPRRQLLEALAMYGGSLKSEQLTVPDRRLASMMQPDGLVLWNPPSAEAERMPGTLRGWVCCITEKGRAALAGIKSAM